MNNDTKKKEIKLMSELFGGYYTHPWIKVYKKINKRLEDARFSLLLHHINSSLLLILATIVFFKSIYLGIMFFAVIFYFMAVNKARLLVKESEKEANNVEELIFWDLFKNAQDVRGYHVFIGQFLDIFNDFQKDYKGHEDYVSKYVNSGEHNRVTKVMCGVKEKNEIYIDGFMTVFKWILKVKPLLKQSKVEKKKQELREKEKEEHWLTHDENHNPIAGY